MLELRGDGLLGICLSGAGPTVLLFHLGFECEVVKKVFEKFGVQSRVVEMGMSSGYLVEI